jgi:hypothetical protein
VCMYVCMRSVACILQPQDEVKAFKSKAAAKPKGIPGLAPTAAAAAPAAAAANTKKAAKAPTEKKKAAPAAEKGADADALAVKVAAVAIGSSGSDTVFTAASDTAAAAAPDPAKRLKALKKKLREIAEIERKDQTGLTPEQTQKLATKAAVEEEIQSLSS